MAKCKKCDGFIDDFGKCKCNETYSDIIKRRKRKKNNSLNTFFNKDNTKVK